MTAGYHLSYSHLVTTFTTPKFHFLSKTGVGLKSRIFPRLISFKSTSFKSFAPSFRFTSMLSDSIFQQYAGLQSHFRSAIYTVFIKRLNNFE